MKRAQKNLVQKIAVTIFLVILVFIVSSLLSKSLSDEAIVLLMLPIFIIKLKESYDEAGDED